MKNTRPASRGFTLIELLVVIAIIAILAAILFPVFAQAREKARQITCVSNQKQVLLAMLMYTQDNDEDYPLAWFTGSGKGPNSVTYHSYDWTVPVAPYIKSGVLWNSTNWYDGDMPTLTTYGDVFSCPSNGEQNMAQTYVLRADVFPWANPSGVGLSSPVCPISKIQDPSNIIMGWEGGANGAPWGQIAFNADEYVWTSTVNAPTDGYADLATSQGDCDYPNGTTHNAGYWMECFQLPRYRHSRTSNFMFFDGHVKSIPKGQVNWQTQIWIPGICDYTFSTPPSWSSCNKTPW